MQLEASLPYNNAHIQHHVAIIYWLFLTGVWTPE
jgi:hypothetical protein